MPDPSAPTDPTPSGALAGGHHGVDPNPRGKRLAILTLTALGVVYGDIGTSPLYALRRMDEGFAQRVERARADVAIDDAQRGEGERDKARRPLGVCAMSEGVLRALTRVTRVGVRLGGWVRQHDRALGNPVVSSPLRGPLPSAGPAVAADGRIARLSSLHNALVG